jgi:RNA polymerase sigma factor (sigma-70 family)
MHPSNSELRISRIDTLWTVVGRAHAADGAVAAAQRQLLERYGEAARRYLLAATRDADAADELFQEFALRFLHGRLHGAAPERGRFRDYLKGVLRNMVADHHKRARKRPLPLTPDHPEPAVAPSSSADDEAFLASWRDALLSRSWAALDELEKDSDQPYYTVLRYRADHPETASQEMATALSQVRGKPLTAAGVRQILHRARERFADLLLEEIAQALAEPTDESLSAELIELGLMDYCRPALERRDRKA